MVCLAALHWIEDRCLMLCDVFKGSVPCSLSILVQTSLLSFLAIVNFVPAFYRNPVFCLHIWHTKMYAITIVEIKV